MILERMDEYGAVVRSHHQRRRHTAANETLNQIYANVLNKPILVPQGDVTSLGSVIFAFLRRGPSPPSEKRRKSFALRIVSTNRSRGVPAVYNELFPLYRKLYFGLGSRNTPAVAIGDVLPGLRDVAERVRRAS